MKVLRGGARRLLKWTAVLTTPLMLAALLILIFASAFGRTRTFVIDAVATGAVIVFEGTSNSWPLSEATLCARKPRPEPRTPRGEGFCDARVSEERPFEGGAATWRHGATARLQREADGSLSVTATGAEGLPDGTRLRLSLEQWRKAGALVFNGHVAVGGEMSSGQTALLVSGRYEAREPSLFGLGGSTETVKSGDLRRGERVSLVDYRTGEPASGFGHVSAPLDDDAGFHVVSIAKPGDTALKIEHLGGRLPNLVRPNWIDYALTSPFFVALALILSLMVGVGQLVLGVWESFAEKTEARKRRPQRLKARAAAPETAAEPQDPPPPEPPARLVKEDSTA